MVPPLAPTLSDAGRMSGPRGPRYGRRRHADTWRRLAPCAAIVALGLAAAPAARSQEPPGPTRSAGQGPELPATPVPGAPGTAPANRTLDAAQRDLERQRFQSALRRLVPCLRARIRPDLEECLYLGEHAALGLYDAERRKRGGELEAAFAAVGIKLRDAYDGPVYGHDFFRRLARRFPLSRHAAEFEYVLIEGLDEHMAMRDAWKPGERKLLAYLERFPSGPYAVRAELRLACIYEGLWDVLRPANQSKDAYMDGYRSEFTTGSRKRDASLARGYRVKAMAYYRRALAEAPLHPDFISTYDSAESRAEYRYDLDEARRRLREIPKGVSVRRICIFWD